ncbi:dihydroorotase [bacterium]|nr:dihydroorotase [bacterium]
MKLVIKNGIIVNPAGKINGKTSLVIEDGMIAEITENPDMSGAEVIDAQGMIVAPGFIDIHVHFREPGYEHKEDILTGLNAAAAGGFTSVCTMPNTNPVPDNAETVKLMIEKAAKGNGVRLYPVASATKGIKGVEISDADELKKAGAVALSDDGRPVQNTALLKKIMEKGRSCGMKYVSHSEDLYLAEGGQMNEGRFSNAYGMKGIPVVGEASQIARDCMLAEYLDVPLHISHVSAKMSVDMIRYFKSRGVKVTCETAPHYITLTDEAVRKFGTNAKINPPLRTENDRLAMIEALKEGVIDAIATDHAPHHQKEKEVEFSSAPCGIVGLETALPLVLMLYHEGILTIERVVELFTAGYRIMGVPGGIIEKGAIADITIFDPDRQWTIDKDRFMSKSRNTPFHGFNVQGAVFATIADGKIIYKRDFR